MSDFSRRAFVKQSASTAAATSFAPQANAIENSSTGQSDREYWVKVTTRLADPVLTALAQQKLKAVLPVEAPHGNTAERCEYTYLEALGRLLSGISAWLESGDTAPAEAELRRRYSNWRARQSRPPPTLGLPTT